MNDQQTAFLRQATALKTPKGRNLINLVEELLESFELWA